MERGPHGIRGSGENRIDIRIAADPIEFFVEEHMRQRVICTDLDRLAGQAPTDPELAQKILIHTRDELPLHMLDEEEDLFLLLRRRAQPEDELEKTLFRLDEDHENGKALAEQAVIVLEAIISGKKKLSRTEAEALRKFADHERRHLIVENAIILPLARVRLTKADLETLALRIAARRGFCLILDGPDA